MNMERMHYRNLALMVALSFISMYILMYAMVNSFSNVFNSVNQFYMAGLMVTPMIVIEILLMGMMYENRLWNGLIIAGSVVLGVLLFFFIRQQVAVGDAQFLRSMIPHHAGAVLMCENASIRDPEIKELCAGIMSGQQQEIDQMKTILNRIGE